MIIRQNTHAPFRMPVLLINPKKISYNVMFTPSCRYQLGDDDQADINKLFGIGYFPSHKMHSVRIGWRWDEQAGKIELLAYGRKDWYMKYKPIGHVETGQWVKMEIHQKWGEYHDIKIDGMPTATIYVSPNPVGYLLRPYFGGNKKAPHDMWIEMRRS